ncbi:J domain-containing protein-like [Antedon mediterranea]|uniref:J domain-containing protein-like n=1 Tax=Antedon mediterranea TaxID=105859 RepID=UPI003AF72E2A
MDAILQYDPNKEETLYDILGCDQLSTFEQINVEYKIRALKYHPDKNPGDATAAEEFSKLQQARDILVHPKKRKQYDTWLSSGLHIPYAEWARMKESVKTSMHWSVVKTDPMIESTTKESQPEDFADKMSVNDQGSAAGWRRQTKNDIIKKFRNYDI